MNIKREQAIKLLIGADEDYSEEYSYSEWDHRCVQMGFNANDLPNSIDALKALGVTQQEIDHAIR